MSGDWAPGQAAWLLRIAVGAWSTECLGSLGRDCVGLEVAISCSLVRRGWVQRTPFTVLDGVPTGQSCAVPDKLVNVVP